MTQKLDISDTISAAQQTAEDADALRTELRGTPKDDPDREERLDRMLRRIDEAMRPVRSWVGRIVWEPVSSADESALREASRRLQYARKQLKKMLR